ncbi:hypothetical protein PR202_ga25045 [Eleusine coracana subsp. coracana]|uniref:Pentatricopeptide repeat-containing protein n=1 Tax=Eleusine coracana subsp. coracana TaxID=191504 RepID=A0AAV5DA13_ELECO|nr:hypothetical protein PR202_ga25045 [Eleusine coracana subsp. coracana]
MNHLLIFYSRCGLLDSALEEFEEMPHRNLISWTAMESGYTRNGAPEISLGLFVSMVRSGFCPNEFPLASALDACLKETAMAIFGKIQRKDTVSWNTVISYLTHDEDVRPAAGCFVALSRCASNAIINMLSRCGLINSTYGFFSNLSVRNVVTWNEMIASYGVHCHSEDVMRLFCSLLCIGERPDEFTIQLFYRPSNKLMTPSDLVWSSLKVIQDGGKMDWVSWGVIISAFLKHDMTDEVLYHFNLFRSDCSVNPDEFILASILNACANSALIRQCRCTHSLVFRTGHSSHFYVSSALVDAYAKCGDISAAESAFTAVSSEANDAILYNTMLTTYANHCLIEEALSLYQEMAKLQLAPTPASLSRSFQRAAILG